MEIYLKDNTRNNIISDILILFSKKDVSEILERNENIILVWKEEYREKCNSSMVKYFKDRCDDK